jgi:hypothetical protein
MAASQWLTCHLHAERPHHHNVADILLLLLGPALNLKDQSDNCSIRLYNTWWTKNECCSVQQPLHPIPSVQQPSCRSQHTMLQSCEAIQKFLRKKGVQPEVLAACTCRAVSADPVPAQAAIWRCKLCKPVVHSVVAPQHHSQTRAYATHSDYPADTISLTVRISLCQPMHQVHQRQCEKCCVICYCTPITSRCQWAYIEAGLDTRKNFLNWSPLQLCTGTYCDASSI